MVGPRTRPQTEGEGGRVKEKTVSNVKKIGRSSSLALCRKGEDLIHN